MWVWRSASVAALQHHLWPVRVISVASQDRGTPPLALRPAPSTLGQFDHLFEGRDLPYPDHAATSGSWSRAASALRGTSLSGLQGRSPSSIRKAWDVVTFQAFRLPLKVSVAVTRVTAMAAPARTHRVGTVVRPGLLVRGRTAGRRPRRQWRPRDALAWATLRRRACRGGRRAPAARAGAVPLGALGPLPRVRGRPINQSKPAPSTVQRRRRHLRVDGPDRAREVRGATGRPRWRRPLGEPATIAITMPSKRSATAAAGPAPHCAQYLAFFVGRAKLPGATLPRGQSRAAAGTPHQLRIWRARSTPV